MMEESRQNITEILAGGGKGQAMLNQIIGRAQKDFGEFLSS